MTENNAAQPGLTTEQILSLERRGNMIDDEALRYGRTIESVLLSKLRAEGVQAGAETGTYVEARECGACGHVGINDRSDIQAACKNCDWSGDSPTQDHCPGCAQNGTTTASCPKCSSQYRLLADRTIRAALASTPVAGEAKHDADSVCACQVWWNQHRSRYTTMRQASFAAFAAGKEWRGAAPQPSNDGGWDA